MTRKNPLSECEDCPYQSSDHGYCPTYIPEEHGWDSQFDPPFIFVGQAPGDDEVLVHVPFSGPAGKQHYSLCLQSGINKPRVPHMNVVNCHPGKDHKGNDLKPSLQAQKCCEERLRSEIQAIHPKLIIALGDEAMFALVRQSGIKGKRGAVFPLRDYFEYECDVFCCLHPSFVRRARQWIPLAVQNYKEAIAYYETGTLPTHEFELILDPDIDELTKYLSSSDIVYGVDTEATGLSYFDDEIIGHSFARDTKSAVAVAYTDPGDPRRSIVAEFLSDPERKKCWQNGSYDTGILEGQWGIKHQGFEFDTRLAQQLLAPDLPSDLDFLRSHYTTIKPYKPTKQQYKRIASLGKQKILELAAKDAITTKVVMHEMEKKLHASQLNLMQTLLIPLVNILNEVELKGVLCDQNILASLYMQLDPLVESRGKEFWDIGLNPNSPKQLTRFLDVPTTDKKFLKEIIKKNRHPKIEWMEKLLAYKKVAKLKSTYIVGIYKRLRNGRIHTHWKIEGTGTGRLASEDPNLQNVPDVFRSIYIPDPGFIFYSNDYKQIELWVLAILAEEWQMLDDLKNGLDIHYIACQSCFPEIPLTHGNRKEDFTHWQELAAKTVVFGTAYGRGKRSIGREFGVSDYEAERWQNSLLGRWPGLKRYRDKCTRDFERKGYVTTPFGRVRYLEKATQGLNTPIQSTAADVMLTSYVMLHQNGVYAPLTVYDDITAMIPLNEEKKQAKLIREIMTRPFKELGNVSFQIDTKKGMNWYEMEKVNHDILE